MNKIWIGVGALVLLLIGVGFAHQFTQDTQEITSEKQDIAEMDGMMENFDFEQMQEQCKEMMENMDAEDMKNMMKMHRMMSNMGNMGMMR